MSETSTKLILITGFLGSGKTTFLHEGLQDMEQAKIAMIFNKQGQFSLQGSGLCDVPGNSTMGSSLLQIIDGLLPQKYDYILVETAGLAQPWVLNQLINNAEQRSCGKLRFRGIVCVIDALRFLRLFSTVISMYEQAAYADCFVLSKADLAKARDIQKIKELLNMIRPTAPVFIREQTSSAFKAVLAAIMGSASESSPASPAAWSNAPVEALLEGSKGEPEVIAALETARWNISKHPKSTTLIPEAPVNREQLESFLNQIAPKTFIIKGFIHLKGTISLVRVKIVENCLSLNSVSHQTGALCLGLTFVWKYPSMPDNEFIRQWTAATGVKGFLIAPSPVL